MSKPKKKKTVKKPNRATFRPSPLDLARADFDAASRRCLAACVSLTHAEVVLSPGLALCDVQDAGFDLREAYAALLRAQLADAPIPVKLTPKGEKARLCARKPRAPVTR